MDLYKDKVAVEMEWSRFGCVFGTFSGSMLLYRGTR